MRVWAAFLLFQITQQDGENVALILLPLACLALGLGFGILLGREGLFFQFKEHIERHSILTTPVSTCRFCKEERAPQNSGFIGGAS